MSLIEQYRNSGRWVNASGPKPAALAFVAEAPSREEVRLGAPLVGPSGVIGWQFGARYGRVFREGAYVTNWRKVPFTDEEKKKITQDEIREWTEALITELAEVKPKTVVALGAWAVEALLGRGHSLFWSNGIAFDRGDFTVIPVVHPAAGLHEDTMLPMTAFGFEGVRAYFEGRNPPRKGWQPGPVVRSWREFREPENPIDSMAIDTEGWVERPYMLTFAINPTEAYYIYADDKEGIAWFVELLEKKYKRTISLILHNAVHDAQVIRKMTGINVWDYSYYDTMVLSFVLQNLPRGLKDLTKRELAINMEEYLEVVGPWQKKADEEWKRKLYVKALTFCEDIQQFTPKGKPRMSQGQPVYKRVCDSPADGIVKHLERNQNLAPHEQSWGEVHTGKRPGPDLVHVPKEIREAYAGKDAAATIGVFGKLLPRVVEENLMKVATLDQAVLPLIEDMERTGMHVDLQRYWDVMGEMSVARQEIDEQIRGMVAAYNFVPRRKDGKEVEFNPGSDDQVEQFILHVNKAEGVMKLTERTESGKRFSVSGDVLEQMKADHPFIPLMLDRREHTKYENSYLLPLRPRLREAAPGEWRAFPDIGYTTVVSGRFNSRDLTWPARTELGLKMRSIFTAPKGRVLASWDLSQIELRIAAAFSHDEALTEAFVTGKDPHTALASRVFKVPYEEADEGPGRQKYRTPAKNTNYMLVYGGTWYKLWEMMGGKLTPDECKFIFNETWKTYSGLKKWLRSTGDEGRSKGYVSDFLGRRRFLPGMRLVGDEWPAFTLRAEAERQGGNFKVQAAAAELIKRAMQTVWEVVYPELKRLGIYLRLWLQVHDELMGEMDEDEQAWKVVDQMMTEALTQDAWLLSPIGIETEGKRGHSWADLK